MAIISRALIVIVALVQLGGAFPSWPLPDLGMRNNEAKVKRNDGFPDSLADRLGQYQAPKSSDSRGPCPALNTLANHGLINRSGRNITSDSIKAGMPRGFGIAEDGFDLALQNFAVVCEYVTGYSCAIPGQGASWLFPNLTLLAEPHAFEHDHSFSRQDYKQNYARGQATDNIYFNQTVFQTTLEVLQYHPSNPPKIAHASFRNLNAMRLQRESLQNQADFPGWFQENIPVQLTEVGFIAGAMFDRDSNGDQVNPGGQPLARLDWWNFWFSEESFPTNLGWVPASTEFFNLAFITSVSSEVPKQSLSTTPSRLPSDAANKKQPAATRLPDQDPSPVLPLFTGTPYVAPTAPSAIQSPTGNNNADDNNKRDLPTALPGSVLSAIAGEVTSAANIVQSALDIVGPAPTKYNFYAQALQMQDVRNQVAAAQSYESAVLSAITSLLQI